MLLVWAAGENPARMKISVNYVPDHSGPIEPQDGHSWVTPGSPELQFEMFSTFPKLSFSYWLIKSLYAKTI